MKSVTLREQIGRKLFNIFGLYLSVLTALIVLLAVSGSLFYKYSQLQQHQSLVTSTFSAEVSAMLREADSLGNSSLIWTGLTDSVGRDVYLAPLLNRLNNNNTIRRIDLLDYKGRDYILSTQPGKTLRPSNQMIQKTIDEVRPFHELLTQDDGQYLVFTLPVVAPFSDGVLGILLISFNVTHLTDELHLPKDLALMYALTDGHETSTLGAVTHAFVKVPIALGKYEFPVYLHLSQMIWDSLLVVAAAFAFSLISGVWLFLGLYRWTKTFSQETTRRLNALVDLASRMINGQEVEIETGHIGDEISSVHDALLQLLLRQRAANQQLLISARVFETAAEAILITDVHGRIVDVNTALIRMTGYEKARLLGKPAGILYRNEDLGGSGLSIVESIKHHGEWRGETFFTTADKQSIPTILSVSTLLNDKGVSQGNVAIFSDVRPLKAAESRLKDLIYIDQLTGLPNYRAFFEYITERLNKKSGSPQFAVLFIDLDHLKSINDSYGHEQGDVVIKQVAQHLSEKLPGPKYICRRSGDEFIAVIDMNEDVASFQQRLKDSIQAVALNIQFSGGIHLTAGFSAGAAMYPSDADNINDLLIYADTALLHAKESGRSRIEWLNAKLIKIISRRNKVEAKMAVALMNQSLSVNYQPEVDLRTGKILGFEALARWHDDELGMVSPAEFIPIAEKIGVIDQVTELVLMRITEDIKHIQQRFPGCKIAINSSPQLFAKKKIFKLLAKYLGSYNDDYAGLVLEFTESELSQSEHEVNSQLQSIIGMGIEIAIDDFGKGYSSMSRLANMPVHKLKIDSSFISALRHTGDSRVVASIMALSKALKLDVTAEGVESNFQREILIETGCFKAQGFYFSKPLPLQEVLQLPSALRPFDD